MINNNRIEPIPDPRLPTPLYYQLQTILNTKIDNGDWQPGDLIPTENELIKMYNVSRTTVREAINALVNEGKLEKRQGRGTTVCKPKIVETLRSEERRVGKECRSLWWLYHFKKNK